MTSAAPIRAAEQPLQIRLAEAEELSGWNELVRSFEHCRVFHERAWLRSIEQLTGAKTLYLLFERGGCVVGCLPGFVRRLGPLRLFGSPFEGLQTESLGPLFDPERLSTEEIVAALVPFLERRLGVHHIELVCRNLDAEAMQKAGFAPQPLFTYLARLFPGDEAAVLARMKSNARNHLRKAQKLGLSVLQEEDESFVDECYDQMREVFTRRGNAIPFSQSRLLTAFRAMRDSGNLVALSARIPGTEACAATGIFLADGQELILWCWTHRTEHRPSCPTEILLWTAMQKGMERGCTVLDMTGGGDAKPKFGGEPDSSMIRWTRSRYAWIAQARTWAKRSYRWQQSVRGRAARLWKSRVSES